MVNWTKGTHKIIFGTPRSGSTFVAQWYANEFSGYQHLSKHRGFEHFHPVEWPHIPLSNRKMIHIETKRRINQDLTKLSVFKLHPGSNYSHFIFNYIKDKPVIVTRRRDILGQFLSYGLAFTTDVWMAEPDNKHLLWPKRQYTYKKSVFNIMERYLIKFDKALQSIKNIEREVWFEDLPNWPSNGENSPRQNPQNNEEKLKLLSNREEFEGWFNKFTEGRK